MPKLRLLPYLFLIFVAFTMTVGCGQRDGRSAREMYDDLAAFLNTNMNANPDTINLGLIRSSALEIYEKALEEGNDTVAANTAYMFISLYGEADPEKMIEWSRTTQSLYRKAGMQAEAEIARIGEIKGLYRQNRITESLEMARDYDTILYNKNASYRYDINTRIADALLVRGDTVMPYADEIVRLLRQIDNDPTTDSLDSQHRALLAISLFHIGDMENAFNEINKALVDAESESYGNLVYPYHIKAWMFADMKDYYHAFCQMVNAMSFYGQHTENEMASFNRTNEGISEHYELKLETERLALERSRAINVALALGILLVIVIAIAVVSRIRTRNRQQVAEMSASMARLEADILDSHRISDTMRDRLKALFADRFDTFNEICELWYRNNESAAATADMKRGMEALIARVSDPALADELDALIDSCSDGWMTHLRTACPDLNDDQRRLAGYLFTGFSSESIMILTRRPSVNSVYVAKSRLKKAISDSGAPDTDEILATLGLAKKAGE